MMQVNPGQVGSQIEAALAEARYVSLTTLRRDGRAVATPVWQVTGHGTMWAWTGATTGKARRLHRNPKVVIAPCTARGRIVGSHTRGVASLVPLAEGKEAFAALRRKYGWQMTAMLFIHRLVKRTEIILLRISLDEPA
jgi:PPOX class probable F420-dependent enzyme